jgi:hypothetical protein
MKWGEVLAVVQEDYYRSSVILMSKLLPTKLRDVDVMMLSSRRWIWVLLLDPGSPPFNSRRK